MIKTDVAIISTNISRKLLNNYLDYEIIDKSFKVEELLTKKKIIFFNCLQSLNKDELRDLFNVLRTNNIEFINITNNVEEVLSTKYLIAYDKEKIILEGDTIEVLKNEKILKRIGLELPFIVELSILLQDYDLIDRIYLNKEELVSTLWK